MLTSSDGAAPDRLSELEGQVKRKQKELKKIEREINAEKQRRLEVTNKKKRYTQEEINALDELKDFVAQGLAAAQRLRDPVPILPICKRITSMLDKVTDKN
ncbi:hypothetical protein SLS56_012208 [Neofusicoccum ribis]|uniref:Uncharacterized protein n=1 Tax=Neofusicoccum ribis TaxID=45134 RepID=A0ABR3S9G3_9PEZI